MGTNYGKKQPGNRKKNLTFSFYAQIGQKVEKEIDDHQQS